MNANAPKAAITAALLAVAAQASAVIVTLPTPSASVCCDTESSAVVPIGDWSEIGRRVNLTLSAHATPSNNVQVAFGKDLNGDDDLEPEEVELVAGVDCGVWFVRDERPDGRPCFVLEDWHGEAESTNGTRTVRLRQVPALPGRFDLAKVTVRGTDAPEAQVAAEFHRAGNALMLR